MPHLDLHSFPGQLLWLLVCTLGSYAFNKLFFLPYLSGRIKKRNQMISECVAETKRMQEHAMTVREEIEAFGIKTRNDSKLIIENALYKSQEMLSESISRNHENFNRKVKELDANIKKQRKSLENDISLVVTDVKEKVTNFILNANK
jgi:F0F1-type ATP synthase membrane subunit b/b'